MNHVSHRSVNNKHINKTKLINNQKPDKKWSDALNIETKFKDKKGKTDKPLFNTGCIASNAGATSLYKTLVNLAL